MLSRRLSGLSRLNMEILDYRCVRLDTWWSAQNISSPFSRIYLVTEGTGYLRCRDRVVSMKPGNVYVVPAGLRFSYWCEGEFRKAYFHVSVPLPSGYDLLEGISEIVSFYAPEIVAFVGDNLCTERLGDMIRIKSMLYEILYRCLEGDARQDPGSYSDQITGAMEYIESNLSAGLTGNAVAEGMRISLEKLRKTFRAETGIPIGKYIHNRVMNKAELEVRRGEYSVKEISEKLGFSDQFYFSRCFSEKYGLSPVKYRKKIRAHQ